MSSFIPAFKYCEKIFDGTHETPKSTFKGYPLITSKNILGGKLNLNDVYNISEFDYKNIQKRSAVKQWDILFSMIGSVGEIFLEKNSNIPYAIKNVGVFSCDNEDKARWLYYYFKSPIAKKLIQNQKNGAVQKFISLGTLRNFPIIPYRHEYKGLIQILSALDAKIELNNQINSELEKMAKTLYDYWFVQFDFPNENGKPYKSSGGKMVWNQELKREIPEGWEVRKIGEYADVKKGDLITEKDAKGGEIKVVAAGIGFSYTHSEHNRDENTITISGSGANAGFINFWRESIFASDCITIRGKTDADTILILHHLKLIQSHILNQATGSAQPHVYPSDIKILNYAISSDILINEFGKLVIPMNKKIANNLKENQKLIQLRDWLLPMLMNGQVKVE